MPDRDPTDLAVHHLKCIDLTLNVPIEKAKLLQLIKEQLDTEFPTDVVEPHSRITVTLDMHRPVVPEPCDK